MHRLAALYIYFCGYMKRQGFTIYHTDVQCRDLASLYILLLLYAETGLHYISL